MGGWGLVFETPERGPGHRGLEDETPATPDREHSKEKCPRLARLFLPAGTWRSIPSPFVHAAQARVAPELGHALTSGIHRGAAGAGTSSRWATGRSPSRTSRDSNCRS